MFFASGSRSIRSATTFCTVLGIIRSSILKRRSVSSFFAGQNSSFDQRPHAFFGKEGISFSALDQQLFQRCEIRIASEQFRQQFFGVTGLKRVYAELSVIAFIRPFVVVLGPVVDQKHEAGHRDAVHQNVEKRLGFVIDPVEVFENQQQILSLAFPDANPFERIQSMTAALLRVHGVKASDHLRNIWSGRCWLPSCSELVFSSGNASK